MIAVAVRMRDDELVGVPGVGGQPVPQDAIYGLAQREGSRVAGRAGVQQQRPAVT